MWLNVLGTGLFFVGALMFCVLVMFTTVALISPPGKEIEKGDAQLIFALSVWLSVAVTLLVWGMKLL